MLRRTSLLVAHSDAFATQFTSASDQSGHTSRRGRVAVNVMGRPPRQAGSRSISRPSDRSTEPASGLGPFGSRSLRQEQSRPYGFDPRAHLELLAGGTRAKGPPLCGVVITARRPGALLTGLATALAVGTRRSGVAITAPTSGAILQASASLRPSIRRHAVGRCVDVAVQDRCAAHSSGIIRSPADAVIPERQVRRT